MCCFCGFATRVQGTVARSPVLQPRAHSADLDSQHTAPAGQRRGFLRGRGPCTLSDTPRSPSVSWDLDIVKQSSALPPSPHLQSPSFSTAPLCAQSTATLPVNLRRIELESGGRRPRQPAPDFALDTFGTLRQTRMLISPAVGRVRRCLCRKIRHDDNIAPIQRHGRSHLEPHNPPLPTTLSP